MGKTVNCIGGVNSKSPAFEESIVLICSFDAGILLNDATAQPIRKLVMAPMYPHRILMVYGGNDVMIADGTIFMQTKI